MTKAQYLANTILFLPLVVLNFLTYGIDGVKRFVKEMMKGGL